MLVLTRKVGERILVGKDVIVTAVRIGHRAVRIGIEAPDGTRIMREELLDGTAGSDSGGPSER